MNEFNEKLYTPNNIAELGILSLVKQWQERKSGRLKHYKIGKKILYSHAHIEAYLQSCEQTNETTAMEDAA